jgi:hypothetical protein
MVSLSVFYVTVCGGPLKVAVELDAVGWIDVNALHPPAQALALGQTGHHLEGITKDHPVRPVLVVLVELRLVHPLGHTIEVGKKVDLKAGSLGICLPRLAEEVVDQHLRMDLFLNVQRRGVDDEIAPVLLILAAPDELGIKVNIPGIPRRPWAGILLVDHGLMLGSGDVLPLRLVVLKGLDRFWCRRFPGHDYFLGGRTPRTASDSCLAVGKWPLNSDGSLG